MISALNAIGGLSKRMFRGGDAEQRQRDDHFTRETIREEANPPDLNRLTPEERYQRDPMFHTLVDTLQSWIMRADYTPTEIREAAMLACIIVEMRRPARPIYLDASAFTDAGGAIRRCSKCRRNDCWADVNGTPQCQNCGTYARKDR